MASIQDVEQVADDLESLVRRLRDEVKNGPDFERLIEIADEISEHADGAAGAFSNINDVLTNRIKEITDSSKKGGQRAASRQKEQQAAPASQS
jgi:hypothetical protein